MDYRPTIAITMGDPAGVGPEVIVKALADPVLRQRARYVIYGMNELLHYAADLAEFDVFWWRAQYNGRLKGYPHDVVVVDYDQYSMLGSAVRSPSKMGGEASMRFCVDAIEAAQKKLVDAVVTAPIAKGQLITRQNTQVPAGSRIAALRAKQDAMLGYAPAVAQAVPA